MKTNVSIYVSSEEELMSEIVGRFGDLNFKLTLGMHDSVYEWEITNVTPDLMIILIDKLQKILRGLNVELHFVTNLSQ